jgi:hypothetical protein
MENEAVRGRAIASIAWSGGIALLGLKTIATFRISGLSKESAGQA